MMQERQVQLVPVRRQRAVRRRALRSLSRQPGLGARKVAQPTSTPSRTFPPPTAASARDMAHAPVDRVVRAARQGERLRQSRVRARISRSRASRSTSSRSLRPIASLGSRWADLDPLKRQERPKDSRARAGVLRPHRGRHGHGVQRDEHLLLDRRPHDAARDRAGAARDVLRHDRRRVHALHRAGGEALVAAAARVDSRSKPTYDGRGEDPHPRTTERRPRGSSATCTPSTSARSASRSKAARASSPRWTSSCSAPAARACRRSSSAWPTVAV